MADFFVSYTSSDREWAFWIANELRALGHTPHVHEWEIKSGDDIYAWMEQRHDAADHVLCVVSDAYLKAPYSTLERNAALWQAAAKRPGFVLLVAVKPCRLPTLADHLRRCELHNLPQDAARSRFHEFMAKRDAPATFVFPGQYAVSNIPVRVPTHFLGRDDALAEIETALKRYEGRVAITALHGLRGVGKTTLAAAYAERHRADYRATWWIKAQTESTMRADLVGFGVRLKWVAADEKEEPALAVVTERLRQEGEGVLLVYDNAIEADALRPYLPRGGRAHVLVTSNAHAWRGVAEPVEIRLWPKEIGADYLIARIGREHERQGALALSEALGGLPLAHEQAAAYCERLDIPLDEYRKRFEAAPARLLDDARHAPADYHDGLTVAKTFALAIDEAAKLHPAAEPLIVHAALLAPEPIPLFLFSEAREKFGEPLASALEGDGLDEAVAALRTFALVDRETIPDERDPTIITESIRLHRLVRQVAQSRCEAEHREEVLCVLVAALDAVYPKNVVNTNQDWHRARRLNALALPLVGGGIALSNDAEAAVAGLLDGLAGYSNTALAAYAQARSLWERALAIRQRVLGSEHPGTATILNNLGLLFQRLSDLASARQALERASTIYEKALGAEHRYVGNALGSLAVVLQAQGDLAGARPLFERAVAICEKVHGPDHPLTAGSLGNLATLLQDQGKLSEARLLYERSLAIHENALGRDHFQTAISLNNLADLLHTQHNLSEARPLYERALQIHENVFGPDHPITATTLSNLARLSLDLHQTDEAEALFHRAITISDKAVGPDHLLTQRYQCHYARLLLATDRASDAAALGQTALTLHERASGPAHPWTKDSASVTADALDALGRADEAKALRERYGVHNEDRPKE